MPDESKELDARPYPHLLSDVETKSLLLKAENLWSALEKNNLGGFSGINRPFFILNEFKEVIEEYGGRDVGLHWSYNDLQKAKSPIDTAELIKELTEREERLVLALKASNLAISEFLECPKYLDKASIPEAGISANPAQVVYEISYGFHRLKNMEIAKMSIESTLATLGITETDAGAKTYLFLA